MTFVDRKSRYTLAGKLPNKRAENFNRTARDTFAELDEIKSITYDNGTEMSGFDDLEQILDCPIFFADPGKPGQRGLNENTNGLLRQYFRKYSDFSKITQKDVDKALFELNNRPRKCLDFLTPAEVFSESKNDAYLKNAETMSCCTSGLNPQLLINKKIYLCVKVEKKVYNSIK